MADDNSRMFVVIGSKTRAAVTGMVMFSIPDLLFLANQISAMLGIKIHSLVQEVQLT